MMPVIRAVALSAAALCLFACGGGGGADVNVDADPLLAGDPAALAIDVLENTGPVAAAPADVSGDLLLNRMEVVLSRTATVAQFNAAAAAAGATGISSAASGSPFVTLIVPRQADGVALLSLVNALRGLPGIVHASAVRQLAALWLPGEGAGTAHDAELLGHMLASRFPAAWNASFSETGNRLRTARDCTPAEATVLVVDFFQSLPEGAGTQLDSLSGAQRFGRFDAGPNGHGWAVAATLAASFDESRPTGALALNDCVNFVLVDITGLSYPQSVTLVRRAIDAQVSFAPLIINLSVGFSTAFCGPDVASVCTPANVELTPVSDLEAEVWNRVHAAIDWAVGTSEALDARLLLVQAAGNEAAESPENGGLGLHYAGIRQADLSSPWSLATRLDALDTLFDPGSATAASLWTATAARPLLLRATLFEFLRERVARDVSRVPGVANLLLVGSTTLHERAAEVVPSLFSNEGAGLYAVGEQVVALNGLLDGTSFAAPQVSALAAYLWTLSEIEDGGRPVSETATLIRGTASPGLLLDAYAATLTLDVVLPHFGPDIRQALLDVNGDDVFDERDLLRFAEVWGLDDPGVPGIPELRDYGRFDLNGDGYTGGVPTAAFDLDRNQLTILGGPVINTVDREIEGYTVTFDEAILNDLQILCYYAYSTVYGDGNASPAQLEARTAILGNDQCVGVRMEALLPAQINLSGTLEVVVEAPLGDGQYGPAPDLHVALTPVCGSVSPIGGRTDAEGRITATVTAGGGCTSVSVTAMVRADEGGPVLAQQTRTAEVINPTQIDFTGTFVSWGGYYDAFSSRPVQVEIVQDQAQIAGTFVLGEAETATFGGTLNDTALVDASVTVCGNGPYPVSSSQFVRRADGYLNIQFTYSGADCNGQDRVVRITACGPQGVLFLDPDDSYWGQVIDHDLNGQNNVAGTILTANGSQITGHFSGDGGTFDFTGALQPVSHAIELQTVSVNGCPVTSATGDLWASIVLGGTLGVRVSANSPLSCGWSRLGFTILGTVTGGRPNTCGPP